MVKCPGCDLELEEDNLADQKQHMEEAHGDIIAERLLDLLGSADVEFLVPEEAEALLVGDDPLADFEDDPVVRAGLDLVQRTGARETQIRCCGEAEPMVFMAVATYGVVDRMPVAEGGEIQHVVGAGFNPHQALMKLCDELIDGGTCTNCDRPTGVTEDWQGDMPLATAVCWYRYDPSSVSFVRGCD